MPRRDTGPEVRLRRELHARGLRFRTQLQVPGRPDVAFTRVRLAVFVDGCFWHRCPMHATSPRHNSAWWQAKLDANVQRDVRQTEALRRLGWTVLRFWEHECVQAVTDTVEASYRALRAQT
jgi:DNA mismatch endonuclease (patch repair protein)